MSWTKTCPLSIAAVCYLLGCGTTSLTPPGGQAGSSEVGAAGNQAVGAGAGGMPTGSSGGVVSTSGTSGSPGALGGTSAAGAPTSGAGGGGNPSSAFTLLFRDDFDALDLSRWQLMTHSWDTNLALFGSESVMVANGQMELSLLPAPAGTVDSTNAMKSFLGAEVRSKDTLTYGRVRARVRFASGSAVVSSVVSIYTPWPADDWNELDIEVLGKAPASTQFNAMVYTGTPPAAPVTQSVTPTQYPKKVDLGFDPSADFHVYEIEWTPQDAHFSVDDAVVYTWTEHIDRMKLPQNVLMTIWASSSADWAGAVSAETGQAKATYDWIELYRFGG